MPSLNRLLVCATALAPAAMIAGAAMADSGTSLRFEPVKAPVTDAEKRTLTASPSVTVAGRTHAIGYHVIARSGDKIDGTVFGRLSDRDGKPLKAADGGNDVSVSADFTSLLPIGDRLFSVTHFESRPAAMYLTELAQDPATGALSPVSTESIDFAELGGLWVPCAGSVTPWNTHLGSEEYPPNARTLMEAATFDDIDDYWKPMLRYFGLDPADESLSMDRVRAAFKPYNYGYPVEVTVDPDGGYDVAKHYAMGRMSLELAYVMPDRRTVYMTDDGTNVGLYMFVADAAGQLTAGTLYAMKWNQTGTKNGGSADLDWISLGHATFDEIRADIDGGIAFDDIFETAEIADDGTCEAGFTAINTSDGAECLKLEPGMEVAASRLETRRYAAMLGATTELRKEEGIAFDAERNRLYVAMSAIERGMEDHAKGGKANDQYDRGGPNHIRLPYNKCGAVFGLDLGVDDAIGSNFVATDMAGEVIGAMTSYPEGHDYAGNKCDIDGIANPDNLTFIPGHDTLVIGEDTGLGHQNDTVWAYNVVEGGLTRIETTPYGSETTSPYFYPNVGGRGYLMSVVQHPYGESDKDKLNDPADARAYIGYIGPFPRMD